MLKIFLCLSMSVLLSACGSQLRKPFCAESLQEIPDAMIGTYSVTMPKPDPSSNNATTFEQQVIQITKAGVRMKTQIGYASGPGSFSGDGNRLCIVGGQIYIEKENDNSTFTISKVEPTEYGLAFSELSFSTQDLKEHGIPFIVVPGLQVVSGADLVWIRDNALGSLPVIVDNSSVSPEKLVTISKRASMYMHFARMKTPPSGLTKFYPLKDWVVDTKRTRGTLPR